MTDRVFPPPYDGSLGRTLFVHQPKPVRGVGLAAAMLIGVATVLSAVDNASDWHRYRLVNDYVTGRRPVTIGDLEQADDLALLSAVIAIAGLIAAGVVFLVWLWRARQNAENLCMAPHRRERGWVVGSWICPVVNFWFPFMVVDDIYRASRPGNPPDLIDLRSVRGTALLGWWWALWLADWLVNWIATISLRGGPSPATFRTYAIFSTLGTALLAGAAVLIVLIMREISVWQTGRTPT